MTGSTRAGPLKPPINVSTIKSIDELSSSHNSRMDNETTILRSSRCHGETPIHQKMMTPVRSESGQPIQLTPLWEHVVRTRRFPSEVDTRETFDEITVRLRDPEWEVRQHALRVLVDVLPTLDSAIIDDSMNTVLPELVNNLGHLAPAVRKGALDTLRVYLVCSRKREDIVRGILNDSLSRPDNLDNFHKNLTLGVILSTPSLLFPSTSITPPSEQTLRRAIHALSNRLIRVTHQEASLRSLVKIHEFIGTAEFDNYLNELDVNAKRDYEILCDVYKIKPSDKALRKKKSVRTKKFTRNDTIDDELKGKDRELEEFSRDKKKNDDGEVEFLDNEEKNEKMINSSVSGTRIVLETEININDDTAITMTIIERDNNDNDDELIFDNDIDEFTKNSHGEIDSDSKDDNRDTRDSLTGDEWIERRKTPRRVHFGGEIVKLRTPDSDDSELVQMEIVQTRIPIPIAPQIPITTVVRTRKSRSNPSSPNVVRSRLRKTKSVTNIAKRDIYTHDASLSPKKSILARNGQNSHVTGVKTSEECKKKMEARVDRIFGKQENDEISWAFEIFDNDDNFDSSPNKIDSTKKKRNSIHANNIESRTSANNYEKFQDSTSMIEENFNDTLVDDNSRNNRELSRKKGKINDKIVKKNTNDEIIEQNSNKIFHDSNSEKIVSTKKSTSPMKKSNSSVIKNEKMRNNEINKIQINASFIVDSDEHSVKNLHENLVNLSERNKQTNEREFTKKKHILSGKNDEITLNNEIAKIRSNESREVVRMELFENSSVLVESLNEAFNEEKRENNQETEEASSMTMVELENRQVEEKKKFESTKLSNEKSSLSPRSPKKLVYETFPRKERNYILMELSSPIKTSSRRASLNNDDDKTMNEQNFDELRQNTISRVNSPIKVSTVDVRHEITNNLNVTDSILLSKNEKNDDNNLTTSDSEVMKKSESFDIEESPLNDIVINEITKFRESNWEDLGLVDQEVLNDLHNKDDWRARVRGLERVASALRTSSALIAIESRLGSLLQAVLGGERSCRVAAAGMAVARVVVAGVSEEALKRRLPQVAWGLARQGGPNAAQLARVAMLRLRPALLLEQLLQPHCIRARNAKTRENALQLLIFSLVTFPSTEFKVENVAQKVATMVGDRRRRVRQAALDTLAVLAQIYEPEEVTKASKLAAKGQQDGDAMLAAIRARLARKSLPMVSADGLVLYGLQISPTVQIATGADVDWIVAGSGSVSPGTGRTRGQIIATTTRQGVQEKNAKNESTKNRSSSKEPNFVALGVGLEAKNEQKKPLAWQLVQHSAQDEKRRTREKSSQLNDDENFVVTKNNNVTKSRLTGTLRQYRSATTDHRHDDSYESNDDNTIFIIDDKDVLMKQRKTEENFHRRMDEIYAERTGIAPISQDVTGNRLESRIPVPRSRDREASSSNVKRDFTRKNSTTVYPRRGLSREINNLQNWSAGSRVSEISRPQSMRNDDHSIADIESRRNPRIRRDSSSSPQRFSPTRDTSIYRQGKGFADGNVYREVQTAPTTTSYDVTRRRQSLKDTMATRYIPESRRIISNESRTSTATKTTTTSIDETTRTRRLNEDHTVQGNSSFRKGDKSTNEEDEYNEINKRHFSVQANSYKIQNTNEQSSQCPARSDNEPLETSSSNDSSTNVSGDDERLEILEKIRNVRNSVGETNFVTTVNDENILESPSAKSTIGEKSFDVITHETNPSRRNSIDCGISSLNVHASNIVYTSKNEINDSETDKDSTSNDEISLIPRSNSSHENFTNNHVIYENESSDLEETSSVNNVENIADPCVTNVVASNSSDDDAVSKVSDDSPFSNESAETNVENLNISNSPARIDSSSYAIMSLNENVELENTSTSTDENDGPEATTTMSYVREYTPSDVKLENTKFLTTPRVDVETPVRLEIFHQRQTDEILDLRENEKNIISILVASRRQSWNSEDQEEKEASIEWLDLRKSPSPVKNLKISKIIVENEISRGIAEKIDESTNISKSLEKLATNEDNTTVMGNFSRDSTKLEILDRTSNNESPTKLPEVNGTQAGTSEKNEAQKRAGTSRVTRMRQKTRTNIARVAPMQPISQTNERNTSKTKTLTQQCFTQLESNDWEIAIKGLKGLSQIARQQPEQLDSCQAGIIGRLLGRHVRNLRSQVSRAACLAAGDVFGSQARCIDQDLDDIAGPLLLRTADTNKFLRADSNEALDRMVQHFPPNKTILLIVNRGATHQNAIIRATTARLLASIVDRVGPDWTMSMPRDVREKLIGAGAKLLMDGNLDARNQAKRMFRKLSRCEGFRKILKDSVPESTLRHIDKTLKSL